MKKTKTKHSPTKKRLAATSRKYSKKTPMSAVRSDTLMQYDAPLHPLQPNRPILSWHAPEYVQQAKGFAWYLIAGIITVLSVVGSFLSGNWSMGLAIGTLAVVYLYLQHYHPPQQITVTIALDGIYVGERFFAYSHIQAFWIFHHHGVKTLNLRIAKRWWSDVTIQLNDQDPVAVRHYLVTQIHEWEGKHEHVGDIVLRLLKL